MSYNWEEIFKNTSSQELYKIYKGQTPKTGEAIHFAKKELDRRGFDFKNMDNNRKNWQLINTLEDEEFDRLNLSRQNTLYISFKKFILICIGTLVFFYVLNRYENKTITEYVEMIPFLIIFSVIWVLINNLIFKYQLKTRKRRQEKIRQLKKEVDFQNNPENKAVIEKDVTIKENKLHNTLISQIIITSIIIIMTIALVMIYQIFIK